jgi:hypothetical protein
MNRKHILLWVKWFQDEREDGTGGKSSIYPKSTLSEIIGRTWPFGKKYWLVVRLYDPETNCQSLQYRSPETPRSKKNTNVKIRSENHADLHF